MNESGRGISGAKSRAQSVFVVGEMAMALVLLIGAGLMIRTLAHLWGIDPGFDPHNVVSFGITPSPSLANQSPDAIRAAFRRIDATIQSVPGIEHVSITWGATLMNSDDEVGFWAEGQPQPVRMVDAPMALEYVIEPDYLKVMRVPLLRGRFLTESDNEHGDPVAVIDNSFANKYFHGQDAIGKVVKLYDYDKDPNRRTWIPLTVVGVVGHVNQFGLADDSTHPLQNQIYRSFLQSSDPAMHKAALEGVGVYIRTHNSSAEAVFKSVQAKLLSIDSDMVVSGERSEEEVVSESIASQRFSVMLLGAFAVIALLLASIGIYGVLSYLVGQRTREIGLRMALGAARSDVLGMVLNDAARMTLTGVAIGIVGALGLTHLMASMLYGVRPTDPLTFGAVAIVLCGVALFACYLPARRAMRVDPMVALRCE